MKWKREIEQLRAQEIKLREQREHIEEKQKIWKESIEKKELEKKILKMRWLHLTLLLKEIHDH